MTEETAASVSGPELSAAFQLGFFARYFDPDVLVEALDILQERIAQSMLRRLKQAVQASGGVGEDDNSFVTAADRALAPTDLHRTLYELGVAMGAYHLEQLRGVHSADASSVWDCIQRMPDRLIGLAGCLQELAEAANGSRNLPATLARISEPSAQMLKTDDQDQYLIGWRTIFSASPAWVQRAMIAHGYSSMVMFVLELSRELAEGRQADTNTAASSKERELSPGKQAIIDVIRAAGQRLTTDGVVDALAKAHGVASEGTTKVYLSELVSRRLLTNRQDVTPKGYGLPEWE